MPDLIPILRPEDMLNDDRMYADEARGQFCPACLNGWLGHLPKLIALRMQTQLVRRLGMHRYSSCGPGSCIAHWNMSHTKAENARLWNSCIRDALGDYDVVDDEKENRWGRQ